MSAVLPTQPSGSATLTVILICRGEEPPVACLEGLVQAGAGETAVFCCCPAGLESPVRAMGKSLLRRGALTGFDCLSPTPGEDWRMAVNAAAGAGRYSPGRPTAQAAGD